MSDIICLLILKKMTPYKKDIDFVKIEHNLPKSNWKSNHDLDGGIGGGGTAMNIL